MADTTTLEDSYLVRNEEPRRTPGATYYTRIFRVPADALDTLMPAIGDTARDDTSEIVVSAVPHTRQGALAARLAVVYMKRVAGAVA